MSTKTAEKAAQIQDLEKQHPRVNGTHENSSHTSSLEHLREEAPNPPPNPWMDPSSFPDGGRKAWMTVAASSACFFVSWGWINCEKPTYLYYLPDTDRAQVLVSFRITS
jgi:hypothetical protein